MDIILIKHVRKLGKIGEIIKVKDGFGRNYLIPQGIAIRATANNKELIEQQKQELEAKNMQAKSCAEKLAQKVAGKDITFIKQAADDGRLFGSVNNKEVAAQLSKVVGEEIAANCVNLEKPIKTLGVSQVELSLHAEVVANIIVNIARTESEAQDAIKTYKASSEQKEAA